MRIPNPLARVMDGLPWFKPKRWQDDTSLSLPGVEIRVRRWSTLPVPHEVSVIVPRMEVRIKRDASGGEEMELILSSITVVHSPRPEPTSCVDACRDRC
ncbi:MAG: hypothetical protein ACM3X4_13750 [Ignavibacteriales bacterium]